jgi:hypothetical protein
MLILHLDMHVNDQFLLLKESTHMNSICLDFKILQLILKLYFKILLNFKNCKIIYQYFTN